MRSEKNSLNFIPNRAIAPIWKPGTKYVTNQSKITFKTIENNPKVTMLIGKNKILSIGRAILFSSVNTIVAKISVVQSI